MRFHKTPKRQFDAEQFLPAIRQSICTGERVAGFVNRETGGFSEVMLIRTERTSTRSARSTGSMAQSKRSIEKRLFRFRNSLFLTVKIICRILQPR